MSKNNLLPAEPTKVFERFQQGDGSAFGAFYEEHFDRVCLMIQHMVGQLELAEDFVSTAFAKLYARRANIKESEQVYRFLFVVARNEAIDYFRAQQRHRAARKEQVHLLDKEYSDPAEAEQERAQCVAKILELAEQLPPAEKRVFNLNFITGLSIREIANQLGRSESTVRNQRNRAVVFLRQAFFLENAFLI
jgi:RNA polymerase sigma-70 factor (ECF subfamily)